MNSYHSISLRYLTHQKKRTGLTLLGVVLSVALICAVSTMMNSLLANIIQQVKDEDGSHHFQYQGVDASFVRRLEAHTAVDRVGVVAPDTSTHITASSVLALMYANRTALELLPLHLSEGRLPVRVGEVAVERWVLEKLRPHPSVGSTLASGLKLSGIMTNSVGSQLEGVGRGYLLLSGLTGKRRYNAYVKLRDDVNIGELVERFRAMAPRGSQFVTNYKLLNLLREGEDGDVNKQLNIIIGFLVALTVVATVAVIYNAFQISVLERMKQFGLLRSIGATPRQISRIVLNEATVLAAFGIPLGVLVGLVSLHSVIKLLGSKFLTIDKFGLVINPTTVVGSMIVGLASVYMSAYLPARKASQVSPLEAVNKAGSIVAGSRPGLLPKLLTKLGIEYSMAHRNLTRSKAKYRVTCFSVAISVVLVIVFTYFTGTLSSQVATSNETVKLDFIVTSRMMYHGREDSSLISEQQLSKLSEVPGVSKVYPTYKSLTVKVKLPPKKVGKRYASTQPTFPSVVSANVELYDTSRIFASRPYVKQGEIDGLRDGSILLMQKSRVPDPDGKGNSLLNVTNFRVGDEMTLVNARKETRNFKVAALLDNKPFGSVANYGPSVTIICGEKAYRRIGGKAPLLSGFEVVLEEKASRQPVKEYLKTLSSSNPAIQVLDTEEQFKQMQKFAFQMNVFVYGFLVVIGLISSLNIVNSISTSIILRAKEFAALRAIGMSMKQIKQMVRAEGVLYGVSGATYGVIVGLILCNLLYKPMNGARGFEWEAPFGSAAIAFISAICVGLLSVVIPLRRIEEACITDGLRCDD